MYHQTLVIGYLGNDPEGFEGGANFSVATSEKWKSSDGEDREHTEWYRVTVYGKQAESCLEYLKKGSLVLVEGRNRTTKKEDRYFTNLIANRVRFLNTPATAGDDDAPF